MNLALGLMIVPAHYLANAMCLPVQHAAWEALMASPEAELIRTTGEPEDMARLAEPLTPQFDGAWIGCHLFALFLYGLVWRAAAVFWLPKPETETEKAWRRFDAREAQKRRDALREEHKQHQLAIAEAKGRKPFSLTDWLGVPGAKTHVDA